MITVFVDMDGVLCDFEKSYPTKVFDKTIFENQIMEHKIFEKLDWEPNGERLILELNVLADRGINIEFLSSLGSTKNEVAEECARQKTKWLLDRGINFKRNFVVHKGLKKHFANPNSILIDDTEQNIWDFIEHNGMAVHYNSERYDNAISNLHNCIRDLMTKGDIYDGR